MEKVFHTLEPLYDEHSKILILGTMPSVLSRKQNFYYGNPRNRFYDVLSRLFGCEKPQTVGQKKAMLLDHHTAVFDVLGECEIKGSSDLSIRNARPNDLSVIFKAARIKRVFANGKTAYQYYRRFFDGDIVALPSTSPANAAWTLEKLVGAWAELLNYL